MGVSDEHPIVVIEAGTEIHFQEDRITPKVLVYQPGMVSEETIERLLESYGDKNSTT